MDIGFIGIGNMGGGIVKGYLAHDEEAKDRLFAFSRTKDRLEAFCRENKVTPCGSIEELVKKCRIIVLAVKPKDFPQVLARIAPELSPEKAIVSIAAGITMEKMEEVLGKDAMIIRTMPNTPVLVGEGMTSLSRNANVTDQLFDKVLGIFSSLGRAEEVSEEMIHSVVGVSGSSPAYTYMYIDALARTAEKNGMEYETAIEFAAQAVLGAAKMVLETGESPEQLRTNVCSPGGTTIEAVNALYDNGFMDNVAEGFQAALEKSKVMSK